MNKIEAEHNTGLIVTQNTNTFHFVVSCSFCKRRHLKCDRALPKCNQCAKRKQECCYEPPKKKRAPQSTSKLASKQPKRVHEPVRQVLSDLSGVVETTVVLDNVCKKFGKDVISKSPVQDVVSHDQYIPRGVPLPRIDEIFESRVFNAHWYASRAIALFHVPAIHSELVMKQYYLDMEAQLKTCNPEISDTSDMVEICEKLSGLQLLEAADHMFLKAKREILHPDVYPHILNDANLAHACCLSSLYIIARDQNTLEAKLLNSAVKVFLQTTGSILDVDIDVRQEKLQLLKNTVASAFMSYIGMQMLLFFNKDVAHCTIKDLIRIIHKMAKATKYDTKMLETKRTEEELRLMEQILLDSKGTISELLYFLEVGERVFSLFSFSNAPPSEICMKQAVLRSLQLYAILIEQRISRCLQPEAVNQLKNEYSNRLSRLLIENMENFIQVGPALSPLFRRVSDIHLSEARALIIHPTVNVEQLSQAMGALHIHVIYLDGMSAKYTCLPKLALSSIVLKDTITVLSNKIASIYAENSQASETFLTPNDIENLFLFNDVDPTVTDLDAFLDSNNDVFEYLQ